MDQSRNGVYDRELAPTQTRKIESEEIITVSFAARMLGNPLWLKMLRNVNEFGNHVRQDPENWPLVVVTVGTIVYGGILVMSKYYEAVPKFVFKRP